MSGKIDKKKFSKETIVRKKRNRKYLAYSVFLAIIMTFIYKNYTKLAELKYEKAVSMEKEKIVVNNSFLARNEKFYLDEIYLRDRTFLEKEWEKEHRGVKFYGKPEIKKQEYYTAAAHESSETESDYRGGSR